MTILERIRDIHMLPALILGLALLTGGQSFASPVPYIAEFQYSATEPVCLLIVPGGTGPGFAEARAFGGALVDASMRMKLMWVDEWGSSGLLPEFPADMVVILPMAPTQTQRCESWGIAQADMDTDAEGWTTISNPPSGGGWSDRPIIIEPYTGDPDYTTPVIYFNSPDINADGLVDLIDVTIFARDFMSGSAPLRSDFVWDGVLDLLDVVVMSEHLGASCH